MAGLRALEGSKKEAPKVPDFRKLEGKESKPQGLAVGFRNLESKP